MAETKNEQTYTIKLNRRQLILLCRMSERAFRNICGQLDLGLGEIIDKAIKRNIKNNDEAHKIMDKVKEQLDWIRTKCWRVEMNQFYGIRYNYDADLLWDIHQVLRHQLWLEDARRESYTVASSVFKVGKEPLIIVKANTEIPDPQGERIYALTLNRRQLKLLSQECDSDSRNIIGQLDAGVGFDIDEAIFKHYEGDARWKLRDQVKLMLKGIYQSCWNLNAGQYNGIRYDDEADILFDMYQVLRHQLWLEKPNRSMMTVDADVHQWGDEPLIEVERNKV